MSIRVDQKCDRCNRVSSVTAKDDASLEQLKTLQGLAAKRAENLVKIKAYLAETYLPEELPECLVVSAGSVMGYGTLCVKDAADKIVRNCTERVANVVEGLKPVDTMKGAQARKAKKAAVGETPPAEIAANVTPEPVEPPAQ